MTMQTEATYENGLLYPSQPLPLPEHARVTVTIHSVDNATGPPEPPKAGDWVQRVRALVASAPKVSHIADDSRESIYE